MMENILKMVRTKIAQYRTFEPSKCSLSTKINHDPVRENRVIYLASIKLSGNRIDTVRIA